LDLATDAAQTCPTRSRSGTGAALVAAELVSWTNLFVRLFQLCNWYDEPCAARLNALLYSVLCAQGVSRRDAGHELLRQIGLGGDIPVWEVAEERWARERNHDQVRTFPFFEAQQ
jgi:hypothetical protein